MSSVLRMRQERPHRSPGGRRRRCRRWRRPTLTGASPADGRVTLSWTAPSDDGGAPVTGYVVTPYEQAYTYPPSFYPETPVTFTSPATSETVTGLENGFGYFFTVAAVKSAGTAPRAHWATRWPIRWGRVLAMIRDRRGMRRSLSGNALLPCQPDHGSVAFRESEVDFHDAK